MEIFQAFSIHAAHYLPQLPETHRCRRLHGHTFKVEVYLRGPLQEGQGWVRDFADIGAAFAPLHEVLDHSCLNEIPGLENPTSENLARWLWQRLQDALPELARIVVQETPESGCSYEGQG